MSTTVSWQDLRVLGALSPRSGVTGEIIAEPLHVSAPGVTVLRNRSGVYVLTRAPGFDSFVRAFAAQPADPRPGIEDAFTLTVSDPAGAWLPRTVRVVLPRDPTALPAAARRAPGSLFRALEVDLLPAATASVGAWWSLLRIRVERVVDGRRLGVPGVLLRLRAAPDLAPHDGVADGAPAANARILGYGQSDQRGEALLAIAALPAQTFANEVDNGRSIDDGDADEATVEAPVVTFDTPCVLEAVADPASAWPLDYSVLTSRFADPTLLRAALSLPVRAGARISRTITLT